MTRASTHDTIRGRVVLVGYEGLVLDDGPTRLVPRSGKSTAKASKVIFCSVEQWDRFA